MKKLFCSLLLAAASLSASAINYRDAREYAYFLTDKMAYELNLTPEQYNRVYEVNLDYLLSVDSYTQLYGNYWDYRNTDLRFILFDWQYALYRSADYFFRPMSWVRGAFSFDIYNRYARARFFYDRPTIFNDYTGVHWRNRSISQPSPYRGIVFEGRRGGMRGDFAPHVSFNNGYGYANGYDRPMLGPTNGYRNNYPSQPDNRRFDQDYRSGNNSFVPRQQQNGMQRQQFDTRQQQSFGERGNYQNQQSNQFPQRNTWSGSRTGGFSSGNRQQFDSQRSGDSQQGFGGNVRSGSRSSLGNGSVNFGADNARQSVQRGAQNSGSQGCGSARSGVVTSGRR